MKILENFKNLRISRASTNLPLQLITICLLLIVLFFACRLAVSIVRIGYFSLTEESITRSKATPLSYAVINDICAKFALDQNDRRCQHSEDIYTPEFIDVISKAFSSPGVTFDEVEEKLGVYRIECSPSFVTSDKKEYFICEYDLSGDEIYKISIFFYSDGKLMRIHFS